MRRSLPGNFGMFFFEFRKERAQTRKWRGPDKEGQENIVFLCDFCFAFTLRKSRTYTQIHTPPRYNGVRGEGGWVDGTSLRSLWYVAVFRHDFTFSGKPLIFLTRPPLNLSQNVREGWTNSYWKRQVLMFYPLGKNSKKTSKTPLYIRGLTRGSTWSMKVDCWISVWYIYIFLTGMGR